MFTGEWQKVYGSLMPVQRYDLHWSCGCVTRGVELASHSVIADKTETGVECPRCYKGPYANVWD